VMGERTPLQLAGQEHFEGKLMALSE